MIWMSGLYPCCKRRDQATQRSALMDCHCSHSHCNHYTYDDCSYWNRQEFQRVGGLVGVDLGLTACAVLLQQASNLDPVLIGTYPALE